MEKINKKDNLVNWRDLELTYVDVQKLDDNMIHIVFEDRVVLFLINDILMKSDLLMKMKEKLKNRK